MNAEGYSPRLPNARTERAAAGVRRGASKQGPNVMADAATTVAELKDLVRQFVAERAWEPFHTPKNLAMGLAVEAAELMEHFLWLEGPAAHELARDPARREAIAEELADVLAHVMNFSLATGIDLSDALRAKMAKNALKYPADKYRGRFSVP